MTALSPLPHHSVVVVGGGQAGLSVSAFLVQQDLDHVVFERHRIAHTWRTQRWDSFCLVTPNWQCKLPGFPYAGADPHGFMQRDEIVTYVENFASEIAAPVREGVGVAKIGRAAAGGFEVETSAGTVTADAVVLAVSAYHVPNIPRIAERLPPEVIQLHSSSYRNAGQLPEGEVVVVGSGQSGCQIAEDLHLAGRKVHLVVGSAPRCPRFYRGRDAVDWLDDLGHYDLPVEQHSMKEQVRKKANHYLTGRDGGRDIDLRKFAIEGMSLYGRLTDIRGTMLHFADDLARNLDSADATYNAICTTIDRHIAQWQTDAIETPHYVPVWTPAETISQLDTGGGRIAGIIWATGFRSDWSFVDMPLFDGSGYPTHKRGVTSVEGVYVIGLPWLHTWGSGRFVGVGRDAEFIVSHIAARRKKQARQDGPRAHAIS